MKSKERDFEARRSRTNMDRVRAMRDSEINCNDIPETDEKFWDNAELVLHIGKGEVLLLGEFLKSFAFSTLSFASPFQATSFHMWTEEGSGRGEPQMTPYGVASAR